MFVRVFSILRFHYRISTKAERWKQASESDTHTISPRELRSQQKKIKMCGCKFLSIQVLPRDQDKTKIVELNSLISEI